jgi:hypothetical protein
MRRARRGGNAELHLPRCASIAMTVVVAVVVAVTSSRAVALADPVDPCRSMVIPVCSLVPVLPDLDHDVDLTTNPDPVLPAGPDDGRPGPPVPDDGAP